MRGGLAALQGRWGRGASGDGVAHPPAPRGLDGVGVSEMDRGRGRRGGDEATGLGDLQRRASGNGVATMQGSEASMAWARAMDDNYGGGDDNYPNAVVEMSTEGREEGHGRNRQK